MQLALGGSPGYVFTSALWLLLPAFVSLGFVGEFISTFLKAFRMTTAGEAAALFGADDSAADPFSLGALGAEADQAVGQDPFAGQDLHSATDLFGSTSAEDSAFLPQNEGLSQSSYEYVGTNNSLHASTGQYTSGNYSDPSNYAGTRTDGYAQEPVSQGYSSQPGQWGGYEPQQYNPPGTSQLRAPVRLVNISST